MDTRQGIALPLRLVALLSVRLTGQKGRVVDVGFDGPAFDVHGGLDLISEEDVGGLGGLRLLRDPEHRSPVLFPGRAAVGVDCGYGEAGGLDGGDVFVGGEAVVDLRYPSPFGAQSAVRLPPPDDVGDDDLAGRA